MRYRYLSDCHIHSDNSSDGADPVMMLCERAASLGFYTLAITDHCECDAYFTEEYDKSIRQSFFETHKAKAVFDGRLKILSGVELGQPLQNLKAAEDALTACEFDFVLASAHVLPGREDFYCMEYIKSEIPALLQEYFQYVYEMTEWGKFDSLAHLTYPLRYMAGKKIQVDLSQFQEEIDRILLRLIADGKALEINTSGLRQEIGCTLPDLNVVSRFRELGGTYVTIGSDAHRWADVGAGVEDGMQLAQRAGFKHFTLFEKRTPRLIPIE
ncbi:MAG: histidinol-phosphatase HisJ family protein [Clostridiales bacterium]|jgi:histidinol-phosphatase (PHP family)|nr:histidinol-phosphatase HisJ family protein [Clostridiales bacterium]